MFMGGGGSSTTPARQPGHRSPAGLDAERVVRFHGGASGQPSPHEHRRAWPRRTLTAGPLLALALWRGFSRDDGSALLRAPMWPMCPTRAVHPTMLRAARPARPTSPRHVGEHLRARPYWPELAWPVSSSCGVAPWRAAASSRGACPPPPTRPRPGCRCPLTTRQHRPGMPHKRAPTPYPPAPQPSIGKSR
jgi:hypothetical protein